MTASIIPVAAGCHPAVLISTPFLLNGSAFVCRIVGRLSDPAGWQPERRMAASGRCS
jgi:hypothetical protein